MNISIDCYEDYKSLMQVKNNLEHLSHILHGKEKKQNDKALRELANNLITGQNCDKFLDMYLDDGLLL